MTKGNVLSGARAVFSINGVQVGYGSSVSIGEEIEYQPVEVLDNIEIEEFVAVAYRSSFSCRQFRIVGTTVKSLGWFPANGSNTNDHLLNILTSGDLTATLEDSKTGQILATVQQVKCSSHNYSIDARGIVGEDVQFVCIRISDESEI